MCLPNYQRMVEAIQRALSKKRKKSNLRKLTANIQKSRPRRLASMIWRSAQRWFLPANRPSGAMDFLQRPSTKVDRQQPQLARAKIYQFLWKKESSIPKETQTRQSWKYHLSTWHDMSGSNVSNMSQGGRHLMQRLESGKSRTGDQKIFSTDPQILMIETTNHRDVLKILTVICHERKQHKMIPEEYQVRRQNYEAGSIWSFEKIKSSLRSRS